MTRDPNVLSIKQAAKFAGMDRGAFSHWLHDDADFRAEVLIDTPFKLPRISKPRLLRRLHGPDWRVVIGEAS